MRNTYVLCIAEHWFALCRAEERRGIIATFAAPIRTRRDDDQTEYYAARA